MTGNGRKINWVNVVMFFSLALNLFVAGYLVSDSRIFSGLQERSAKHKRPQVRIVDYFPRQEKRKFRRFMFENRENLRPVQRQIIEKQKEIFTIIADRDIDLEKLKQAFSNYQKGGDSMQTALNAMVMEIILDMDYDTRLKVIKRGRKAHERRKLKTY